MATGIPRIKNPFSLIDPEMTVKHVNHALGPLGATKHGLWPGLTYTHTESQEWAMHMAAERVPEQTKSPLFFCQTLASEIDMLAKSYTTHDTAGVVVHSQKAQSHASRTDSAVVFCQPLQPEFEPSLVVFPSGKVASISSRGILFQSKKEKNATRDMSVQPRPIRPSWRQGSPAFFPEKFLVVVSFLAGNAYSHTVDSQQVSLGALDPYITRSDHHTKYPGPSLENQH